MSNIRVVIHWFRRDLRLADNAALNAALSNGASVVPVFVFDPVLLESAYVGAPRVAFLLNSLRALSGHIEGRGGALLLRNGRPEHVLPALVREVGADAVYWNVDYSPYAARRDAAVAERLTVAVNRFDDVVLKPPGLILKDDGDPYLVYTPFMKRWRELPPPARPQPAPSGGSFHRPDGVSRGDWPSLSDLGFGPTIDVPPSDEHVARENLDQFIEHSIAGYAHGRNSLVIDPFASSPRATSVLSPYFRLGMLSPRQAYWAARNAAGSLADAGARNAVESVETWINELIWREFYMHILYHFPHVLARNFQPKYDAVAWVDAPDHLAAWKEGRTGYPLVDAAMRQLRAVGWMPNRARMIVASFLTKDLLIHWKEGERHFMQHLIDGDPAANNGGWQWAAGTGTDAQPYFRIFNPVTQSKRYDPAGDYIRHWIPELRDLEAPGIHAPWTLKQPPADYPPPIVDHGAARERALAAFAAAK